MTVFDALTLIGGLCLFLFGMNVMGQALERSAGNKLELMLGRLTTGKMTGFATGMGVTAVIQSSSASVGILQALAATGAVSYGAAIPIIMGQNIGTCVTAIISTIGANKNAKRAALVHLSFNIIGTVVWLVVFSIANAIFSPAILGEAATLPGIAVAHSAFNILCTVLLLPASALLEKLAYAIIPEAKTPDRVEELDERLLATPNVALERCYTLTVAMANDAVSALCDSIDSLYNYSEEKAEDIRRKEDVTDHYEDIIGTHLVKLSSRQIGDRVSDEAAKHLRLIGDFERISDHAVNIIESAEEMREKGIRFSESADEEMHVLMKSAKEILELSLRAFIDNDLSAAHLVEPLEQVIDDLKEQMRARHILRLQRGDCSIGAGFVWSDILTNIERTADHCSNIAACVADTAALNLSLHETVRTVREGDGDYEALYGEYTKKIRSAGRINFQGCPYCIFALKGQPSLLLSR